jgi:seryl-tRNA synthetase
LTKVLEVAIEVPAELADEFDKKLAYLAEGVESASYDSERRLVRVQLGDDSTRPDEVLKRRVLEIAEKLTGGYQPGFRRRLAHRVRASGSEFPDPHPVLLAEGELREFGRGRFGFGPKLVKLLRTLDTLVVDHFQRLKPRAHQFPSLISGEVLDRCRYLRNFPASLTLVTHLREDLGILQDFASTVRWDGASLTFPVESASHCEVLLAPSVCFHWYAWIAGERLRAPVTITAVGKCFRYESTTLSGLERLWDFSMREVVFVGDADWIASSRAEALDEGRAVLEELDLDYEIATAGDPFFIDSYASQTAYQRGFDLKYELLCPLKYRGKQLAVGSVNYHQDFFGRSFDIEYEKRPCHTACIGFGLERLALAVIARHGWSPSGWPSVLRSGFERLT